MVDHATLTIEYLCNSLCDYGARKEIFLSVENGWWNTLILNFHQWIYEFDEREWTLAWCHDVVETSDQPNSILSQNSRV